jgi:hypothetical protein
MTLKSFLRSSIYQTEKITQRIRFAAQPAPQNGWPTLLGISFPKSGTHLLDQILLGLAQVAPFSKRVHSFYAEYEGGAESSARPNRPWPGWIPSAHVTSPRPISLPAPGP